MKEKLKRQTGEKLKMPKKQEESTEKDPSNMYGHYEYVCAIKQSFKEAFHVEPVNSLISVHDSEIETLKKRQSLIVDGLCGVIAILIDQTDIDHGKIKDLLKNGIKVH